MSVIACVTFSGSDSDNWVRSRCEDKRTGI